MKNIFSKWWGTATVLVAGAAMLSSCNKELPKATPIVPPAPTGQTITQLLAGNAKYSILRAAITRAGTALTFNPSDASAVYTVFAPDNDAFIASGIPNETVVGGLPAATVASIVNAHVIPGVELKAADLSTAFPNMYLQSGLVLSSTPPIPYRMPVFPSRRTGGAWFNDIAIKATDIDASNGVIHDISRVFFPPSQVIAQVAAANSDLTYLMAALQRADAGPPAGAPKLIPVLSNAAANLTVFAPTNQAFQNLFTALGLPTDITTINALPTETVWGIVAFHVLGSRAFSVNLAAGNSTAASIMGVAQQINVTGGTVTVRGPGNVLPTNPPTPYSATVVTPNINAINGVVHVVDAVLLPQ